MLSYCLFSGSSSNFRGGCHCPPQLSCGSPVIPEGQPLIQSSIILPISRPIPFHLHSPHWARGPPPPLSWPGIDSISLCPASQPIKRFLFWPLREAGLRTQLLQTFLLGWNYLITIVLHGWAQPLWPGCYPPLLFPCLRWAWAWHSASHHFGLSLRDQLTTPDSHFSPLGISG